MLSVGRSIRAGSAVAKLRSVFIVGGMRILPFLVLALVVAANAAPAADAVSSPSAERILARTRVLGSDEFEGRAPGTPGEEKTVAYLVSEFRKMGLAPGNPNGTYVQQVPLVGITSTPSLSFSVAGTKIGLQPAVDFVGPTSRAVEHIDVKDSDVVFVGYGIVAPEYGWDDYKGVDVRGKTIVMLINDPPVADPATGQLDPKVFGGVAMTYYGRWTYKYEIAAKKGAAACLIVHETGPAAYPFSVVVTSRGSETFEIRTPDGNADRTAMDGWLTLDATKKLFTAAGQNFDTLKKAAANRDFRPVALGAKASFTLKNVVRNVDSRNVVAVLPGSDAKLKDEYVVYTAHWDHLGRDTRLQGDQIYNGAADNASGVAQLLELAEAFRALPARPKRSILFMSVTAEEKGLLGSRYYAQNPLYPLERTVANINMDGANQFGPTADLESVGYNLSTIEDIAIAVAVKQGRTVQPESRPDRGSYFRSDHFEFARVGVPSYYPKYGKQFVGQPADYGEKIINEYIARHYHQVSDEVQPDWTFTGAAQDTEFMFRIGLEIANSATRPEWKQAGEFKQKRDAMLKGR